MLRMTEMIEKVLHAYILVKLSFEGLENSLGKIGVERFVSLHP